MRTSSRPDGLMGSGVPTERSESATACRTTTTTVGWSISRRTPTTLACTRWGRRTRSAGLQRYVAAKGTLQFPYGEPLPVAKVAQLVKRRVREKERAAAGKTAARSSRKR